MGNGDPSEITIVCVFGIKAIGLLTDKPDEGTRMMVATGLAIFVVICLLLSMVQTPPAIGK